MRIDRETEGLRIFAGTSLYKTSDNCDKRIICAELRSGEICYGELIIRKAEDSEGGKDE